MRAALWTLLLWVASMTKGTRGQSVGFPNLPTIRLEGLVMKDVVFHNQAERRLYPYLRFTCDGRVTGIHPVPTPPAGPGKRENSPNAAENSPRIEVWDKPTENDTYFFNASFPITSTLLSIPFKNRSVIGLSNWWTLPFLPNGGRWSYRLDRENNVTINGDGNRDYPLFNLETDPPGCVSGLLNRMMLDIVNARPSQQGCSSCTDCNGISKLYIGITPSSLRNTTLTLHLSDSHLANGTAPLYPFLYEFIVSPPTQVNLQCSLSSGVECCLIATEPRNASRCSCGGPQARERVIYSAARSNVWLYNGSTCQHGCLVHNMTFTFTGAITGWIFAADWSINGSNYPRFELWRNVSEKGYECVNSTVNLTPSTTNNPYVYKYNFKKEPWYFREGDVLALTLPPPETSRMKLLFMKNNVNFSYCNSSNLTQCTDLNVVPMVTPEIAYHGKSKSPFVTTLDVQSSTSVNNIPPSSSILVPPMHFPNSTSTVATAMLIPISSSKTHSLFANVAADQPPASVVGLVVGLIVSCILLALLVVIVVMVAYKKTSKKRSKNKTAWGVSLLADHNGVVLEPLLHPSGTDNPVYNDSFKMSAPMVEYATVRSTAAYDQFPLTTLPKTTTSAPDEAFYWEPSNASEQLYEQLVQYQCSQIPRTAIRVLEHLGSGEFGTVSKGMWWGPNGVVEVALKTLREGAEERDRVRFLREAAIMGQFRHPNVIQLYGVVTTGEPLVIVLELMRDGDLQRYLRDKRQSSSDPRLPHLCLEFCCQVASGMMYLSKKAFIHRDLATRNILVCNGNICKIADFGMSRDLQDGDYYRSNGGKIPVKWTAPEAVHYKTYTTASDVWSFGCVMYEIWSLGRKPFEENSNQEALQLIDSGYRLPPPPGCPKAIYKLMMQCWNSEKSSRPAFDEIYRTLTKPVDQVLHWEREDSQAHPQCTELGAPLDCGKCLYLSLQRMHL